MLKTIDGVHLIFRQTHLQALPHRLSHVGVFIRKKLKKVDTPDGRPGYSILIFSMSEKELAKQVLNRTGQCVMTSPSSAIFSGNKGEKKLS